MYLDANVVVYAVSGEPRYGPACRQWLKRIQDGEIEAQSSVLLLVECLHVFKSLNRISARRRKGRIDVPQSIQAILNLPLRWLELTPLVVARAAEYEVPLTAGDAVHVATMELYGVSEMLSADAGFDRVPGIRRRDPLAL